jgi:alpha-beta hydrolase superfamily lysophospholipase
MGASVGANAALNFAAAHPQECAGVVLLSPGLNYRGVDVQDSMASLACPVLIVASSEDTYAAQSSQTIFDAITVSDKKIYILENAGHGVEVLDSQPNLVDVVFDWLSAHSN